MQREPFKNNFSPSRRHNRQTGPRYFATCSTSGYRAGPSWPARSRMTVVSSLHPTPLGRPAAVVRNRRDVADQIDPQPRPLQRADRGFTSRSRSVHIDVHLTHAAFHGFPGGRFARALRGKRRAFSRSFEPLIARARPDDRVAAHVGNRHDRVVERGLDVSDPALNDPALFLFALLDAHRELLL